MRRGFTDMELFLACDLQQDFMTHHTELSTFGLPTAPTLYMSQIQSYRWRSPMQHSRTYLKVI